MLTVLFTLAFAAAMLAATPFLAVRVPTLRLRDSLSERTLTSCYLPAIARRVPAMGGEIRSRETSLDEYHFNSFQFAALPSSLAPLHFVLADTPSPRGSDVTFYGYGYIVRGLRTVCCRPAPTS